MTKGTTFGIKDILLLTTGVALGLLIVRQGDEFGWHVRKLSDRITTLESEHRRNQNQLRVLNAYCMQAFDRIATLETEHAAPPETLRQGEPSALPGAALSTPPPAATVKNQSLSESPCGGG